MIGASEAGPPDGRMGWTVEIVTWHRTKPESAVTLYLAGKTFDEADRIVAAEVAARIGARGVKVVEATAVARVEGAAHSVAAKIKLTRSRR